MSAEDHSAVWIGLSKEHYGIHGTPTPETIGLTQSHGCIRLTNWDAERLAAMVSRGTVARLQDGSVDFAEAGTRRNADEDETDGEDQKLAERAMDAVTKQPMFSRRAARRFTPWTTARLRNYLPASRAG